MKRLLATALLPLALAGQAVDAGKAARLKADALASDAAYKDLEFLCDRIGARPAGSRQLEDAIAWAQTVLKREGFVNVHAEPVKVQVWKRGEERGWIEAPARQTLSVLGLGGTVPTPKGGITADVVVVGSFDELKALGEAKVKGKIVCYDVPFTGYGPTVAYRGRGASEAAKLGAVAALVRSVTPVSLDTPHTGAMNYEKDVPQIPAAAVTIENATQLHRLQASGQTPRVHLEMDSAWTGEATSANVVGELPGTGKPEEIVLLGGHLDSWDVGQGAQDDGVGCMIALHAAAQIKRSGLAHRRTLRVVLFTNEEHGLAGGRAYAEAHRDELTKHAALFETDSGNGLIQGFSLDLGGGQRRNRDLRAAEPTEAQKAALAKLQALAPLVADLGAGKMELGGSGADVSPLVTLGAPGLGVGHDASRYWDVHHTRADTFDKIKPDDLKKNVAILSAMAYAVAEMEERLDGK
ncbi:MAG: M20/M25/M40 family metallo-hydrolase [Holophagaceae bacterium]